MAHDCFTWCLNSRAPHWEGGHRKESGAQLLEHVDEDHSYGYKISPLVVLTSQTGIQQPISRSCALDKHKALLSPASRHSSSEKCGARSPWLLGLPRGCRSAKGMLQHPGCICACNRQLHSVYLSDTLPSSHSLVSAKPCE